MKTHVTWIAGVCCLALSLCTAGCNNTTDEASVGTTRPLADPAEDVGRPRPRPDVVPEPEPEPPAEPQIPEVQLTEQVEQESFVRVGDMMPEMELTTLDGQTQKLQDLYGEQATVVFFWRADHPFARSLFDDIGPEVARPRAEQQVQVIAISEDTAEVVQPIVDEVQPGFPVLLDPDGMALAKVGTEKLMPRTYLLDPTGKILWFDVEYSRSTRRDLSEALDAMVGPVAGGE
jgi:peroxiredoxin